MNKKIAFGLSLGLGTFLTFMFTNAMFLNSNQTITDIIQVLPGGGGRYPALVISPHKSSDILVANDMGYTFISNDSGNTFKTVDATQLPLLNMGISKAKFGRPVAWSPNDEYRIFAGAKSGFYQTFDKGANWVKIQNFQQGPNFIFFSKRQPLAGIAVFNNYLNSGKFSFFKTFNGGDTWLDYTDTIERSIGGIQLNEYIVGGTFNEVAGDSQFFLVTNNRVLYQNDFLNVATPWQDRSPIEKTNTEIFISASGSSNHAALNKGMSLYAITNAVVYSTFDSGVTWQKFSAPNNLELNHIHVSPKNFRIAFLSYKGGILKTINSGKNWQDTLFLSANNINYNVSPDWVSKDNWIPYQAPDTITTDPNNPLNVITSSSGVYLSLNGGSSWDSLSGKIEPINLWRDSYDLPVTSVNDYYVDKYSSKMKYHYTAINDFGLLKSDMWGFKNWTQVAIPNFNNLYQIMSEPLTAEKSRVWASGGSVHDLLFNVSYDADAMIGSGGIIYSEDNFTTYVRLPNIPKGIVTAFWIDDNKPFPTVWAAVFGLGIYRSTTVGQPNVTWEAVDKGISIYNKTFIRMGQIPNSRYLYLLTRNRGGASKSFGDLYILNQDDLASGWKNLFADTSGFTKIVPSSIVFNSLKPNEFYISGRTTELTQEAADYRTYQLGIKTLPWIIGGGIWKFSCLDIKLTNCTQTQIYDRSTKYITFLTLGLEDRINTNYLAASVFDDNGSGVYRINTANQVGSSDVSLLLPTAQPGKIQFLQSKILLSTFGGGVLREQ